MAFNAVKAAHAIAFLALKDQNRVIDVLSAIKLIYLADRESFGRNGVPIIDDLRVSMPHGPVHSTTYSYANGERDPDQAGWSKVLQARENHRIAVCPEISEDDLDELSESEIDCLNHVWNQFRQMTKWELRDWTRDRKNIPELEDPHGNSRPIPIEGILTYVGVANPDQHADLLNDFDMIEKVFDSVRD